VFVRRVRVLRKARRVLRRVRRARA